MSGELGHTWRCRLDSAAAAVCAPSSSRCWQVEARGPCGEPVRRRAERLVRATTVLNVEHPSTRGVADTDACRWRGKGNGRRVTFRPTLPRRKVFEFRPELTTGLARERTNLSSSVQYSTLNLASISGTFKSTTARGFEASTRLLRVSVKRCPGSPLSVVRCSFVNLESSTTPSALCSVAKGLGWAPEPFRHSTVTPESPPCTQLDGPGSSRLFGNSNGREHCK